MNSRLLKFSFARRSLILYHSYVTSLCHDQTRPAYPYILYQKPPYNCSSYVKCQYILELKLFLLILFAWTINVKSKLNFVFWYEGCTQCPTSGQLLYPTLHCYTFETWWRRWISHLSSPNYSGDLEITTSQLECQWGNDKWNWKSEFIVELREFPWDF